MFRHHHTIIYRIANHNQQVKSRYFQKSYLLISRFLYHFLKKFSKIPSFFLDCFVTKTWRLGNFPFTTMMVLMLILMAKTFRVNHNYLFKFFLIWFRSATKREILKENALISKTNTLFLLKLKTSSFYTDTKEREPIDDNWLSL